MRLVLIEGCTYKVYEGRKLVQTYQSDVPALPEQIEQMRLGLI